MTRQHLPELFDGALSSATAPRRRLLRLRLGLILVLQEALDEPQRVRRPRLGGQVAERKRRPVLVERRLRQLRVRSAAAAPIPVNAR